MNKLTGLVAAPFTAFAADGEVDLRRIEQQAASLVANNVRGALVCGTTGECGSLTLDERMRIAERWVAVANADFPVVVHVGHSCLKDAQTLARHAARIGAHSICALAPYYFRPPNVGALVEFCCEIANVAPNIEFYYYHLPSITNVTFPAIEVLRAVGDRIPNFAGVKFTFEDLADFGLCLEFENRRYNILCGRDESLLAGVALGASGAVGSTYNYIAPIYAQMLEAFERGDLQTAQEWQQKARLVIDLMVRFGGLSAGKAIMRMIGIDCGATRLPLVEMSQEKYREFENALAAINFFDFCSRA